MIKPPSKRWQIRHVGQKRHVLARRLVIAIVLFSSFITLLSTGGQLYLEYRRDVSQINTGIEQVRETYLQALASSLWAYDLELVKTQLRGIEKLPDVEFLAVYDEKEQVVKIGVPVGQHVIHHEFPLVHLNRGQEFELGRLVIEVSLAGVYNRLRHRIVFVLSTQAAKTFIVSAFMFLLFYSLVGRHLATMAQYARAFSLNNLGQPLRMKRTYPARSTNDELDDVEAAINEMRANLIADIEERQRTKQNLEQSEARYRTLVENIPGTVYRQALGDATAISYVSASIEKLTGFPQTKFVDGSISLAGIATTEDATAVQQAQEASAQNGAAYDVEYNIRDAHGQSRNVHEYGMVIADGENKSSNVHAVIFEVTARREMERRLDETRRLIDTIFEATSDAIFVKDLEGRYLMANGATLEAMGKTMPEVIGKRDKDLFPTDSAAVIETIDSEVIRSNQMRISEEHLETAYGDTYWLSNKCPMRDTQGAVVGLIGISHNITETKLAEKEHQSLQKRLQQAQKMEAIGTLAGGIAHDFNNILGIIMGYTELLRDDAPLASSEKGKFDQVLQACYRARDLIHQILAFSRHAPTKPIPLQTATSIKEALKLLRASIPSTISLHEEIDPESGVIIIEPTQLHQVLMNLCTNAYQALEDSGGDIVVTLQNCVVRHGEIGEAPGLKGFFVDLTVSDNGPGISTEHKDRIFDPYFTTKEIGQGSGMGLAIVHGIVTGCGGVVICHSEPGRGATFRVLFPIDTSADASMETNLDAPPMGQERILYVDDEKALLEMGQEMLEKLGYRVTAHTSSLEALAAFEDLPGAFDLVLSDQTMPEMTGGDLARHVLKIRPDIPIVLCTGYSSVLCESDARAMGIKAYLLKPLDLQHLGRVLREVLDDMNQCHERDDLNT